MRWWTYAILAIALVCGSIARGAPAPRTRIELEVTEPGVVSAGTSARKRLGKRQSLRREATAAVTLFIVPDRIELPRVARQPFTVVHVVAGRRVEPRAIAASARGPPIA
jgi:hypothetical protein